MTRYRVSDEIYSLHAGDDRWVLYSPLTRFVGLVNDSTADLLARVEEDPAIDIDEDERKCLDELAEHGVVNGKAGIRPSSDTVPEFRPQHVTLFPTNRCNLRCTYCYAEAGSPTAKDMPWSTAKTSIDAVLDNVKASGGPRASIGFHGGGEPLLRRRFVERVVAYADERATKRGIDVAYTAATNGVLEPDYVDWLAGHFQSLSISYDGTPDLQNKLRPLAGGQGSAETVHATFRRLDELDFAYGIRATISSSSVEHMPEMVEFIAGNFRPATVSLEPLHVCGRCRTEHTMAPDMERFGDMILRCRKIGEEKGVRVQYSGLRLGQLRDSFCGATRDNFAVTPEGTITTCFEVLEHEDPRSETFFIGSVTESRGLQVDDERRAHLRSLTVDHLDFCKDCFAKWNCGGECLAKVPLVNHRGDRGTARCAVNRKLIAHDLVDLAMRGDTTAEPTTGGQA